MESFKILVLSGGGIKGLLQIGALEELENEIGEIHKHFTKGIYGCSVGSLIAVSLGFGLNITQIKKISNNLSNFNNVIDLEKMSSISSILTKKGIFTMDKFEKVLIDSFMSVGLNIKDKKLCDAFVPLFINASNLSKGTPTLFTGNVPVLQALKASCCIPFIFQPQIINDNIYVDGGFITNILMSLIPKEDRDNVLGLTIIHTKEKIKAHRIIII
jgi:NTE family protein